MIARSTLLNQQPAWVDELRQAYVDPLALLDALNLTPDEVGLAAAQSDFPFRVPRPFVARMRPSNPRDPLLLQVLPRQEEFSQAPGFTLDPVGDLASRRSPALLQKYHGRALLITTGGCAINCRYCFRQHFPYAESLGAASLESAITELQHDPSIHEVILSGGDPLMLADARLANIVERLSRITHLRILRIHTRLPVTIPARLTDQLLNVLTTSRLHAVMVLHINHSHEIDNDLTTQLQRYARAGIQLLNQSVLLRDINDNLAILVELSYCLFAASVLPYYVHLLDPVAGAAHFDVDVDTARLLAAQLRARLPGYLVPQFVREIAGETSKTLIA